jgi:8-oxo-dGTP pyrophosphatase MutT (NUDIX family)
MTGSAILPVSIHKGKIFFLFGKETELEQSAKGFSDFGGGMENGETIYDTAMREGAEELTGFLGNSIDLRKYIHKNGGVYHLNHNDKYHTHIFVIDYDEKLPELYNNNHRFLWEKLDQHYLKQTKLFEKIEIKWFSVTEMKKKIKDFRPFYQDIVKHILEEMPKIKKIFTNRNKSKQRRKHVRFLTKTQKIRKPIDRTLTPFSFKKDK